VKSFTLFDDLVIPQEISTALKEMGFLNPTPVQAQAIPAALEGKDILGISQTGTGKTAAFSVPVLTALYKNPGQQALILAPTRELAAQIHKVMRQICKNSKIRGSLVVGGESFARQARELRSGCDYIVATPGRLNDHLQQRVTKLNTVAFLILDEIDRMLDMGFAPQIAEIIKHIPPKRQCLLFSATFPKEISKLAEKLLNQPVRIEINNENGIKPQIDEQTIKTTHKDKNLLLIEELKKREGKILVFVRTQTRAENLSHFLKRSGYESTVTFHGGQTHGQRKYSLETFRTQEKALMIATDLAGRGIDVKDIEHVINFDPPANREDYVHRIGRTGRFGKKGNALNFIVPGEFDKSKPRGKSHDRYQSRPKGKPFGVGGRDNKPQPRAQMGVEGAAHSRPSRPAFRSDARAEGRPQNRRPDFRSEERPQNRRPDFRSTQGPENAMGRSENRKPFRRAEAGSSERPHTGFRPRFGNQEEFRPKKRFNSDDASQKRPSFRVGRASQGHAVSSPQLPPSRKEVGSSSEAKRHAPKSRLRPKSRAIEPTV
jgi:superfamily II DNA/RNA helicase